MVLLNQYLLYNTLPVINIELTLACHLNLSPGTLLLQNRVVESSEKVNYKRKGHFPLGNSPLITLRLKPVI